MTAGEFASFCLFPHITVLRIFLFYCLESPWVRHTQGGEMFLGTGTEALFFWSLSVCLAAAPAHTRTHTHIHIYMSLLTIRRVDGPQEGHALPGLTPHAVALLGRRG